MGPPVVDAHQHLWDLDRARYEWLGPRQAPINRTITAADAAVARAGTSVTHAVLVQAADNAEDTDHLLAVADRQPEVYVGVVGWLPLDRPEDTASRLADLVGRPRFVGVRTLIHDRPDPDWILRPEVGASLGLLEAAGLPYDVVTSGPRHLAHVPTLAARFPRLRLVVDHLGTAPIGLDREPWWTLLARAAEYPNVHAKVSGLYPQAGDRTKWTVADLAPYVDRALELFGADRLMLGSDWPVSELSGGFGRVWSALDALVARLSEGDRRLLRGETARRCYGLSIP